MKPSGWVTAALVTCAACSPPQAPVATSGRTLESGSAQGRAQTIHIEVPSAPEISDVPRLMALESLRASGYTVEALEYSDTTISIQAMLDGKLDVGVFSPPQVLAAIQHGAAITSIMNAGRSTRVLVTVPEIRQCSDLDNKVVSVPSLISAQALTLQRYIEKSCPGAHIERVVIAGTNNRVAALLAHRTDGALLELTNLLELQAKGITQFNLLSVFGVEFPELLSAFVASPRAFLDRSPATARDILRAWLLATRQIQDPAILKVKLEQYLGLDSDHARVAAKTYLDRRVWDVNGGLSDEVLQTNIEFDEKSGVITAGLIPAMVADLSYLHSVLDAIGRQ